MCAWPDGIAGWSGGKAEGGGQGPREQEGIRDPDAQEGDRRTERRQKCTLPLSPGSSACHVLGISLLHECSTTRRRWRDCGGSCSARKRWPSTLRSGTSAGASPWSPSVAARTPRTSPHPSHHPRRVWPRLLRRLPLKARTHARWPLQHYIVRPLTRSSRLNAEAEDLRGEVERLKRELGETRAENEALQKAEKQRAANAALLVKGALDLARLSVVTHRWEIMRLTCGTHRRMQR